MAVTSVWIALVVVQLGLGAFGVVVSRFAKEDRADPIVFGLIRNGASFPLLFLAAFIAEMSVKTPAVR